MLSVSLAVSVVSSGCWCLPPTWETPRTPPAHRRPDRCGCGGVGVDLVLAAWLPADGVAVPWTHAVPRAFGLALATLVLLTLTGLLVAGFSSAPDPDTGRSTALAMPSVLDWSIGGGGEPVDIVYAPGMVTRPFPGWTYGFPIAGGMVVVLGLGVATIGRLTSPDSPFSHPSPVGESLRAHVGLVVASLCWAATSFLAGGASFFAGSAYSAASLIPAVQPEPGSPRIFTYAQPLHTIALVLQYGGVALVASSALAVILAVVATRDVIRARAGVHSLPRI